MINKDSKIYIAGHNGMVGSACWRILSTAGYNNLIGEDSSTLDLRDQKKVIKFLDKNKPSAIINAAAKVGGIYANNTYPYEFLMYNMLIQNNLIYGAKIFNIPKFIFLGSSCIYPKLSPQPIKEEYLLTNSLEETNQWYAIAKIAGVKLIDAIRKQYGRDYVSLMPTNLYGPGDNFDLKNSHVLPAIIRRFYDAKKQNKTTVSLWGTGEPLREFLHVEDLARAILIALENNLSHNLYNVGSGKDISIKELANKIKKIVGYEGDIFWDLDKPDGTPRKLMDSSKIRKLGWRPQYNLNDGIVDTYNWFKENKKIDID